MFSSSVPWNMITSASLQCQPFLYTDYRLFEKNTLYMELTFLAENAKIHIVYKIQQRQEGLL